MHAQIYVHLTHWSNHFTIIITSSIHVYGWLDSCLLFSYKIYPYWKFRTRYPIIFMGGEGSSLREVNFPRHTNCEVDVKKSSQHWNLYKSNIFLKIIQYEQWLNLYSSDETSEKLPMIKPIFKWWNQREITRQSGGKKATMLLCVCRQLRSHTLYGALLWRCTAHSFKRIDGEIALPDMTSLQWQNGIFRYVHLRNNLLAT